MIKISVGCGKRYYGPKWVHVDGENYPHVTSKDIRLLDYEEDSVDVVFACHLLEYFDRDECEQLIAHWWRVLKPGGILRLAVPDFEALSYAYQTANFKLSDILGPLYGRMMLGERYIFHKICFDFDSLHDLLIPYGFKNIDRYDWRQTEHAHIDDHSQAYLPKMDKENGLLISLNVECQK